MRAIYEDNGSGKLTGAKLQQLASQLPADAEILQLKVEESQKDGWYWSIKARVPEVPARPSYGGTKIRDRAADELGLGRTQRADRG
ncbi:MAG: hypothetical protein RR853_08870 [Aurantimicrobium sp.]|uniref:hypothetical protein n=1 Tax=Aurantimicrobium sp. TaxID=1930784 RepID=UPI002FC66D9F